MHAFLQAKTPFIALEYSIFKDMTKGSEVNVRKTQVMFNIFTMEL